MIRFHVLVLCALLFSSTSAFAFGSGQPKNTWVCTIWGEESCFLHAPDCGTNDDTCTGSHGWYDDCSRDSWWSPAVASKAEAAKQAKAKCLQEHGGSVCSRTPDCKYKN